MSHLFSMIVLLAAGAAALPAFSAELAHPGTLRATFIATNPVQAKADPKTGEVTGPAADLARELGRRLGLEVKITPANGVNGVLENSPLRSVGEIDRKGTRIGVTEGDTADLVLTRTLKAAEIKRNKGGDMDVALKMLTSREIDAYGTNRQRLYELASRNPGLRMLPDNFYGVEQSIIVKKGTADLLAVVEKFLDEARTSGLIAAAITRSGIVGLDVAPPRSQQVR